MTRGETVRRVSVVGSLGSLLTRADEIPQSEQLVVDPEPQVARDRLVEVFEELAREVGAGRWDVDARDGVLFDVIVGGIHCVVLEYTPPLLVELSPREKEIALMVARGRTNQAIARTLDISIWTVSTHLRRIFAKLAVSSRAEMVAHLLDDTEFTSQIGRSSYSLGASPHPKGDYLV